MFAGEPQYIATDSEGHTRIIPLNGEPKTELDRGQIMSMVQEAAGASIAEMRVIDQYDAYYLDRLREKPLPVIYATPQDALESLEAWERGREGATKPIPIPHFPPLGRVS